MKYKLLFLILLNYFTINCAEVSSILKITNNTNIIVTCDVNYFHTIGFSRFALGKDDSQVLNVGDEKYIYIFDNPNEAKMSFKFVVIIRNHSSLKEITIDFFNGHIALILIDNKGKLIKQLIQKLPHIGAPGTDSNESKVNATPG